MTDPLIAFGSQAAGEALPPPLGAGVPDELQALATIASTAVMASQERRISSPPCRRGRQQTVTRLGAWYRFHGTRPPRYRTWMAGSMGFSWRHRILRQPTARSAVWPGWRRRLA